MARITIYFGNYGSGKTELSLKKAFLMSKMGEKVILVDLDIVNPYFRSGEQKEKLEANGIRVIMPNFEGTNVAVPSIPGEVNTAFVDKKSKVIFDVGGSSSGAAAIGRYSNFIKKEDYESILVVNVKRPFTSNAKEIVNMAEEISKKSRIPIKKIINNTNIAYDTTAKMIEDSQIIIEEAAKILEIEVSKIVALPNVIDELSNGFFNNYKKIIEPIELYMRPDWLDYK